MTTEQSSPIEPDTKDWTWVLDEACPECGYDAGAVDRADIGQTIRDNADFWSRVLADSRAADRPRPPVWSPTEYACHVRDVNSVFAGRVRQMIAASDPEFANWDQDETAAADRYDLQDPTLVASQLAAAADDAAAAYDGIGADDATWARPGRRSNGSVFTVESLGRYHLHDLVHHRWDVRWIMSE
ncbi:DinB family protein [Nocardioides caeni]|uniref:DinB family protein n=1 Tax=Nocardioides caeni TaxID=574700 RepID=A0A4S8NIQ5_9ACTN|nr:DinB family protein [Nocardioides caeni]THV15882.1 DinB family protein [Nocardioides caeni]